MLTIAEILKSDPVLERAYHALYEATMSPQAGLSAIERGAIALAVSIANQCHLCIHPFAQALREAGGSEPLIVSLLLGEEPDDESARLKATVYFARKLTLLPNSVAEKDASELRDFGFTETDILQCVNLAAFCNYLNRLADGLAAKEEG